MGTLSKGGARTQCPLHAVQSRPCLLREPSSWCGLGSAVPELTQSLPPSLQRSLRSPRPTGELASGTVVLKGEGSTSMSLLARAFGNGVPGAPPGPLGFKSLVAVEGGGSPSRGIYQRLQVILPHKVLPV